MNEEPATQQKLEIKVNQAWCKSCVICVAICPKSVLEMQGGYPVATNMAECTACALCEIHCPDFAITVVGGRRQPVEVKKP